MGQKKSGKSNTKGSGRQGGRQPQQSSETPLMSKQRMTMIALAILAIAVCVKTYGSSSSPSSRRYASGDSAATRAAFSALDPWPWTDKTQPGVKEVLDRAANLTSVGGRPINVSVVYEDPQAKIVQIDNFLTDDQCDLMIQLAKEQGLQRSTTTGAMKDGKFDRPIDDSRTSSNSWCFNSCFRDPIVGKVDKMIEEISARPKKNMEHYQLLHYEVGQQYKEHHDFIYDQAVMAQGPRQFTFFLYLNDVEAGGETAFTTLGIKVQPKRGRAIMWPNVDYQNDKQQNPRTTHAALPVIKGEKYGANKWIHKGDFLTPWTKGVSG